MKKRAEVKLFNFSFVDILATTIGVLLFIMIMAVLNMSGVVTHSEVVKNNRKNRKEKEFLEKQIAELQKRYKDFEKEIFDFEKNSKKQNYDSAKVLRIKKMSESNIKSAREIAQHKDEITRLKHCINKKIKQITKITKINKRGKNKASSRMLPRAAGGSNATPIHVECRKDSIIILGKNTKSSRVRKTCSIKEINKRSSAYRKLLMSMKHYRYGANRKVLVLWVRPDATATFNKAVLAAKKARIPVGWEPAPSDWIF